MQEFVAYRRLSGSTQQRARFGLDAQAAAILAFVKERGGVLLADFVEAGWGKGSDAPERRPALRQAMALAKRRRAMLVVARLEQLARDASVLATLSASGLRFVAVAAPAADSAMLQAYAEVARDQRVQVAGRISAALQARKRAALAAGQANPLGNPAALAAGNVQRRQAAEAFAARLAPMLEAFRHAGLSQRQMVQELNRSGIRTAQGGEWSLQQLQRVMGRLPQR